MSAFEPRYLNVTPIVSAEPNECFGAVTRQVEANGGSICYGWRIWEMQWVFIEAEFHAVWKNPDGKLKDITPAPQGITRILFLPDPRREYKGRQIKNVRRPLTKHPAIVEFFRACDDLFEFMNRGERANEHGAISLYGPDAQEYILIERRKVNAMVKILQGLPRPIRNGPCPCGSGKKFKKCCYD